MRTYLAVVHHDPGSAYGVSFPDLPGCFSGTDESGDIITNAMEALELWFEEQPLVTPRGIEEIRVEVASDLREGLFLIALIAVPYEPEQERRRA